MLAMIPAVWIVVFAYFALTVAREVFWQTNFVYSRFYGGNVLSNLISAFRPSHLFPRAMVELLPLVLLGVSGLIVSKQRPLLIALFVGTFVAVAMPGQFFGHYYQLWLVPLSLAGACAIASMKPRRGSRSDRSFASVCSCLQSHWWLASPRRASDDSCIPPGSLRTLQRPVTSSARFCDQTNRCSPGAMSRSCTGSRTSARQRRGCGRST